ncbi:transposase [Arthrobacter sp. CG_A4]|nr:transposase [Arthrobacter sp. CG_A4]
MIQVVAGVDTHSQTHHCAVITVTGEHLADSQFPATRPGYEALQAFITCQGDLMRVGVEGTNSYGAGLTRHLHAHGITVVEVIRPARAVRRLKGKSDPIDAYIAAHAALAENDTVTPKTSDSTVEAIRVVHAGRRSTLKARTEAITQIKSLLVTAPEHFRAEYRGLTTQKIIRKLAASRARSGAHEVEVFTRSTLKRLASRYADLGEEISTYDLELESLVTETNPALIATRGISTVTASQLLITAGDNAERLRGEAAFAALCGTSPLPASSGKTTRHRLNRGGDRQANAALHRIALVRMATDPETKEYVAKRSSEGKTKKDILRCLKRTIAREVFHLITNPQPVISGPELRHRRQELGLTLTEAALLLDCDPNRISRLERGITKDQKQAEKYQQWLNAQQLPEKPKKAA